MIAPLPFFWTLCKGTETERSRVCRARLLPPLPTVVALRQPIISPSPGWLRRAAGFGTRLGAAAASGRLLVRGGCCSRPKRSAFIAAPFQLVHVAVLAPECLGSLQALRCLDGEGCATRCAGSTPQQQHRAFTILAGVWLHPVPAKDTAIFFCCDCVAFIPYSYRFSSRCGAGADWCTPIGCCTNLHLFCPAVRIGVCIISHHFAPH